MALTMYECVYLATVLERKFLHEKYWKQQFFSLTNNVLFYNEKATVFAAAAKQPRASVARQQS